MIKKLPQKSYTQTGFAPILLVVGVAAILAIGAVFYFQSTQASQLTSLGKNNQDLKTQLDQTKKQLESLQNEDQVKKNQQLQDEINNINQTYNQAVTAYEQLQDLKLKSKDTADFDKSYASSLKLLADRKYQEAQKQIADLQSKIKAENDKIAQAAAQSAAQSAKISDSTPANNSLPSGGSYSRQKVHTDSGDFIVDIIAADLSSTKVIVDTASDSDCHDNCPVMPLANYASRSGAFAAINGPYFCPATYPSCAGKTNSFDTLLMNKNKHYFNSDNNVYSTVPLIVFSGTNVRAVGQSKDWGRDTSPDSVIANYPLLTQGGSMVQFSSSDQKLTARGPRSFIGHKDNMVYIGFVQNANIYEAAVTVHALGITDALHLDDGGSTALWYGGSYKLGPGRDLPYGVLFVKR